MAELVDLLLNIVSCLILTWQIRETELPPKFLSVNEKLLNKILRVAPQDSQARIKDHFSFIPQVLWRFIYRLYVPQEDDRVRFALIQTSLLSNSEAYNNLKSKLIINEGKKILLMDTINKSEDGSESIAHKQFKMMKL